MKTMMKRWMLILLFLGAPVITIAQSYHRLAASDFAGTPPPENGDIAYTNCYVGYTYDANRRNGNYAINFNLQLTLNTNKSYIRLDQVKDREMLRQILRHEQGHYNIAYLLKCEAYSVLTHHRYTANYQAEIINMFKQVETKYHKINADYEYQTQHMTNTQNQDKWNTWFSNQLDNVVVYNGVL